MNTPDSPEQGPDRIGEFINNVIPKVRGPMRDKVRKLILAMSKKIEPKERTGDDAADVARIMDETPAEAIEALKETGIRIEDLSTECWAALGTIIQKVSEGTASPNDPKLLKQAKEMLTNPKALRRMAFGPQQPIRNDPTTRIGRNDPCSCGSGKKYKNCHMQPGQK